MSGTAVFTSFDNAHTRFCTAYPRNVTSPASGSSVPNPNREAAVAVNWAVSDTLSELSTAANVAARAGIVAYFAVRLRNSLMHVIDQSFDLYTDQAKCNRVFGLMLAAIRLSMHGDKGTISGL